MAARSKEQLAKDLIVLSEHLKKKYPAYHDRIMRRIGQKLGLGDQILNFVLGKLTDEAVKKVLGNLNPAYSMAKATVSGGKWLLYQGREAVNPGRNNYWPNKEPDLYVDYLLFWWKRGKFCYQDPPY